jgi:hypothetical protein
MWQARRIAGHIYRCVYWVRSTTIAATQQKGESQGEGPEHTHLWVHEAIEHEAIPLHMCALGFTRTTVAMQAKGTTPAEGPEHTHLWWHEGIQHEAIVAHM